MIILNDLADKIQSILGDEESMRQIKELAGMFSSGDEGTASSEFSTPEQGHTHQNEQSNFDIGSLLGGINLDTLMHIMGAISEPDKNVDLLLALRSHLSEERQPRVDKVVKMLKFYNVFIILQEKGILGELKNLL